MKKLPRVGEIQIKYNPSFKIRKIRSSLDAFRVLIKHYDKNTINLQEQFFVLYLNQVNGALGVFQVSKGGITSTIVDIRLVIAVGLKLLATGMIISHNHPSGSHQPSKEDISITCRLMLVAKLFDITLLDHVLITGVNSFVSIMPDTKV